MGVNQLTLMPAQNHIRHFHADIFHMAQHSHQRVRAFSLVTSVCLSTAMLLSSPSSFAENDLFKHRDKNGVVTFSDAPVVNGQVVRTSYTGFKREPTDSNPCSGLSHSQLDAKGRALHGQFEKAAEQFSVDPALLKAVARAESCFDPQAVSSAGAKGLMQLMPSTAKAMGVKNILDQQQNLIGGAQYLAAMLARYSSNTHLALAAYNAGPGNVDKYNGVPPFPETQKYISAVKEFRQDYAPQFQP